LRGPHGHWGKSTARSSSDGVGKRTGVQTPRTGKAFIGWKGPRVNARNNVYAGRDGNVYRHDVNGWSKRDHGKWNRVGAGQGPSSSRRSANTRSSLQRTRSSRSMGSYSSRFPGTSRSHSGSRVSRPGSYSRSGGSHSGSRGSYSRGSVRGRGYGGRGGFR
jgi:hypothetical protein